MDIIYDIAIIGGGASGLISAISADKKSNGTRKIAIIEKEDKLGKKILATGNGRCNLTNSNIDKNYYFGSCREGVSAILSKYNTCYLLAYFNKLGLLTKSDDYGRVYPYSNSATSVTDVLTSNCTKDNIDIFLNCDITSIKKTHKNTYIISNTEKQFECRKIIFSVGGQAGVSKYSGNGYSLLNMLNISQNKLFPSLCPVPVKNSIIKSLKGCRAYGKVTLLYNTTDKTKRCISEIGEIQFTEKSLSGICVFNLSRFVNEFFTYGTINNIKSNKISISIDFFPDFSLSELETIIYNRIKNNKSSDANSVLLGILNFKIVNALFKICKINKSDKLSTLSKTQINTLINSLKNVNFDVLPSNNFKNAQVTCGGVKSCECDFRTLSYKKDKNIFFTGEVLDIDGLCGGYNLHWAWISGIIAGENAVN